MINNSTFRVALGGLLFVAAACGGATATTDVPLKTFTLEAVSATTFTSTVGSLLTSQPSVIAKDNNGKPAPGVAVDFAVSGGGGISNSVTPQGYSYSNLTVITNSEGIAALGAWRLPEQPGANRITVTAAGKPAITFSVQAVAGPPKTLSKVAGDEQFIPALASAVVRPQVRVTDFWLNGIPGVTVNFVVRAGGGSVTGASVVTDSYGIATVGNWTVGSSGVQTLAAQVQGFETEQVFTATLADVARACGTPATLNNGSTVQAVLSQESCGSADGKYYDMISVNLNGGAYEFTLDSPDFDTELELLGTNTIAINNDRPGSTNSAFKAIVPAGVYKLRITSHLPGNLGKYSVHYSTANTVVSGCEEAYVTRGLNVYEYSGSLDCAGMSDRFRIFLKAGQPVEFLAEDLSYSDHKLVLYDSGGALVEFGRIANGQWWMIKLSFTAKVDGFYDLDCSSPEDGAEYQLSIN